MKLEGAYGPGLPLEDKGAMSAIALVPTISADLLLVQEIRLV